VVCRGLAVFTYLGIKENLPCRKLRSQLIAAAGVT